MASLQIAKGDRIIEPMIALAGCGTQDRSSWPGPKAWN